MTRFSIFILYLLLLIFALPSQPGAITFPKRPVAEKGILDLRNWDLAEKGTIRLDGEWQLFHNQLISSADIWNQNLSSQEYIRLPGIWTKHEINGKRLSGQGNHTFRLTVLLGNQEKSLAFKLMDINSAYKLYVGNDLAGSSGVIGTSKGTSHPRILPQVVPFLPKSDQLEIVLQVGNFHSKDGGMRFPILLGVEEDIRELREQSTNFEFFLFGSILIMGLYHLGIFLFRRVEHSSLYFALFCLAMALRTLLTGERYLAHSFPAWNWSFLIKIEQLTFFLVVPLFAMFTQSVFSTLFSSRFTRLLQIASAAASVSLVFVTVETSSLIIPYFELLTLILLFYVIFIIIRALRQGREGTVVFLLGFIILFATAINDILFDRQIIFTGFWVPFGVFGMICSQAFFLSGKFSLAFSRQEFLSKELAKKSEQLSQKNIELKHHENILKQKVTERTESIKQLLDNTGQGFLTFNSQYLIEPVYSKTCTSLFNSAIENRNIFDLLFSQLEKKQHSLLRDVLDLVFKGTTDLQDLEEILPSEVELNDRHLKIEFRLIDALVKSEQNRIMVILTDVTLEKTLKKQLELDEERKDKIYKIAADKNEFISFIKSLKRDFQALYQLISSNASETEFTKLLMTLHTVKGNSNTYHLNAIALESHRLESLIEEIQKENRNLNNTEKEIIKNGIINLETCLNKSLNELAEIIPPEELLSDERYFRIAETKIKTLKEELKQVIKQDHDADFEEIFNRFRKQPISNAFRTLATAANKLAKQLSKVVAIEFNGLLVEISYDRYRQLFEELVHVMQNSIDHGIESPDIRVKKGKPDFGRLFFSASIKNGIFTISMADDGCGIDIKALKSKILEKKLATEQDLEVLSNEKIMQFIFKPGFSTKDDTTQISGRGYGLAAVQEAVNQLGGNIHVYSEPEKGTVFEITTPDLESPE
ncbi:hypothetical protein KJ966_11490 [bacterium]|nr:hypothetical protein [bacterium]